MHAHQLAARVPVDTARTVWPAQDAQCPRPAVHYGRFVGIVDGGGDGQEPPPSISSVPLSPGCPPAAGRTGAVQHDAAALVDGEHARGAVATGSIGAVELLGHALFIRALCTPVGSARLFAKRRFFTSPHGGEDVRP